MCKYNMYNKSLLKLLQGVKTSKNYFIKIFENKTLIFFLSIKYVKVGSWLNPCVLIENVVISSTN